MLYSELGHKTIIYTGEVMRFKKKITEKLYKLLLKFQEIETNEKEINRIWILGSSIKLLKLK